jgi:hypothetical protein
MARAFDSSLNAISGPYLMEIFMVTTTRQRCRCWRFEAQKESQKEQGLEISMTELDKDHE